MLLPAAVSFGLPIFVEFGPRGRTIFRPEVSPKGPISGKTYPMILEKIGWDIVPDPFCDISEF